MTKLPRETCVVERCGRRRHYSNGLCTMHWKRVQRTGALHRAKPIAAARPNEAWRPVPGLEGRYEASTHGRLRWVGRAVGVTYPGRIVTGSLNQDGYLYLRPYVRPDRRTARVHQLVALAFLGPCPEGLEVNHIDGNRGNNAPWNLEYVTHDENIKHAARAGNMRNDGELNPRAKLTEDDVRQIRRRAAEGVSQYKLAKEYGLNQSTVSSVVLRKSWQNVF